MRARKEEENGMEKNKGMCKWSRMKWNPQYKVTVRNSTKAERELVLKKRSTISTKRTGLRKIPERGREKRRER